MSAGVRWPIKDGLFSRQLVPCTMEKSTERCVDFIGPLPKSHGFGYLWVVICRLTSMVHLIPINTTTTASELASLYIKEVVHLHRLPHSKVSGMDSRFTSKFWKETPIIRHQNIDVYSMPPADGWCYGTSQSFGWTDATICHSTQSVGLSG